METSHRKRINNLIRMLLTGALAGIIISSVFLAPWLYNYNRKQVIESHQQRNLLNVAGLAFNSFQTYPVEITALQNGVPIEGMSITADGYRWYTPQDGKIALQLAQGEYTVKVAYQNCVLLHPYIIVPNGENILALDISRIPSGPEIIFETLAYGESAKFALGIENADEATIENAPNGIEVVKDNDTFYINIDGAMQNYGFHHMTIVSTNAEGSATTEFCLTVPRETEPIIITTVEELAAMKNNKAGNYILANDLDLSGVDWKMIGTDTFPFVGSFDGGGHTISGFTLYSDSSDASILGYCENAVIQNLIIREPYIYVGESEQTHDRAALANWLTNSYLKNCASIGGSITVENGCAGGLIVGSTNSVVICCFNSTDIVNLTPNNRLPGTGGILSMCTGYVSNCGNEGDVKGNHLTGGIVGFKSIGTVNRNWNTGAISGSVIVGEYPPGGIMQTVNDGGRASYGYSLKGASAAAGRAFSQATVIGMKPLDKIGFRDKTKLTALGAFDGDNPDWAYASLDAYGPVPFGIFKEQAAAPEIMADGQNIKIAPKDGVQYFYSLDGSDPYVTCKKGVEQLNVTLKEGQTLKVFAAQSGFRDSDMIEFTETR